MAVYDSHIDDSPLATGTHTGSDGAASLYVKNGRFRSWGAAIGLAIHNDTQGTDGLITVVTDDTITDDTNTWDNGDTYSIYKTAAKDGNISKIAVDKSRGWKVTDPAELDKSGWLPQDHDLDRDEDGHRLPRNERPWGPGQPERNR